MKPDILFVDAFADRVFRGNPAAVCFLSEEKDPKWMQSLASEINLSETAFVRPVGQVFSIRWFTPTIEVDLCGHATLASAHALWEQDLVPRTQAIEFSSASGPLKASYDDGWIELDFPRIEHTPDSSRQEVLERAMGVPNLEIAKADQKYIFEVTDEKTLRSMAPNFSLLSESKIRCVIATTKNTDSPYDFVSRVFSPGSGVNEDPVTGAAHCALAPYWAPRLGTKEFRAFQGSQRGGELRILLNNTRVFLKGQAVTVMKASLNQVAFKPMPVTI